MFNKQGKLVTNLLDTPLIEELQKEECQQQQGKEATAGELISPQH